jgi:hypothetical protein
MSEKKDVSVNVENPEISTFTNPRENEKNILEIIKRVVKDIEEKGDKNA